MQHPDEGMIHTWLDGELSAEDAAALEAHVADCAQCTAALAEARGLVAGSSRIVSALDSVPGGVIPAARQPRRAWYSTTQFRAAAALLLVAGTSLLVIRKNAQQGDRVTSAGELQVMAAGKAPAAFGAPQVPGARAESGAREIPRAATSATTQKTSLEDRTALRASARSDSPMRAASGIDGGVAGTSANRQAEPAPTFRPPQVLAAVPQAAAKSLEPRLAVQDSANAEGAADEIAVSGNALKLIRTDSLAGSTQRVFSMANGVQLIMTERRTGFEPAAQLRSGKSLGVASKASAAANAPMLPPAAGKDQVRFSDYRTITWVDSATGRSYSLTGPLPPDQLEKFKALVMKLSR